MEDKKLKILVIDDKKEELEKAKEAVLQAGHEVVAIQPGKYPAQRFLGNWIGDEIAKVDAVITDLYFQSKIQFAETDSGKFPPAGLLVVIEAILQNKPVVICTDGSHHEETGWIFDGYISGNRWGPQRFYLRDCKNWERAIQDLYYLVDKLTEPYKSHEGL